MATLDSSTNEHANICLMVDTKEVPSKLDLYHDIAFDTSSLSSDEDEYNDICFEDLC